MAKSATVTTLSVALFSILGFPFLFEIVLIGVLTKVFRKQVLDNEKFQAFLKENVVNCSKEKAKELFSLLKKAVPESTVES